MIQRKTTKWNVVIFYRESYFPSSLWHVNWCVEHRAFLPQFYFLFSFHVFSNDHYNLYSWITGVSSVWIYFLWLYVRGSCVSLTYFTASVAAAAAAAAAVVAVASHIFFLFTCYNISQFTLKTKERQWEQSQISKHVIVSISHALDISLTHSLALPLDLPRSREQRKWMWNCRKPFWDRILCNKNTSHRRRCCRRHQSICMCSILFDFVVLCLWWLFYDGFVFLFTSKPHHTHTHSPPPPSPNSRSISGFLPYSFASIPFHFSPPFAPLLLFGVPLLSCALHCILIMSTICAYHLWIASVSLCIATTLRKASQTTKGTQTHTRARDHIQWMWNPWCDAFNFFSFFPFPA